MSITKMGSVVATGAPLRCWLAQQPIRGRREMANQSTAAQSTKHSTSVTSHMTDKEFAEKAADGASRGSRSGSSR